MKFENLVTYAVNKGLEKEKVDKVLKDMGGKFKDEKLKILKTKNAKLTKG